MIDIEPFSDLIFVHMDGCAACEAAIPELDKFSARHPSMLIIRVRADGPLVPRLLGRMKITATPTYVYRRGDHGISHEGAMTEPELEQWIEKITDREEGDA